MVNEEAEANWHESLERIGETVVRDDLNRHRGMNVGVTSEERRMFAYDWLRQKELERESLEHSTLWYVKWTFWAAIAAVVVGMLGLAATIYLSH